MKRSALVGTIILAGCSSLLLTGCEEAQKSELNVFNNEQACTASGLAAAVCGDLFDAMNDRAIATATLFEEAEDCTKEHGVGGCLAVETVGTTPAKILYRPKPMGIAVITPVNKRDILEDAEPVYGCGETKELCQQSLTGEQRRGRVVRELIYTQDFANEYRYADRAAGTSLAQAAFTTMNFGSPIPDNQRTPLMGSGSSGDASRTPTTAVPGTPYASRTFSAGRTVLDTGRIVKSGSYRAFQSVARGGLGGTARSGGSITG